MFDLTVLPYFVFVFMAIPPFIFGYFKGWRSGLFTIILTLITGGILVGISIGIYEGTLWPLFKGLFVSSHNPGGLDIESLKEISKTSVVSISVGIALLPCVLIMWGLYKGFKKLLNKYMQPKIKKISKNEVGIYRKNLKLTRAGGVVLNGAAGLIIASAAAGAVSTLTVPSSKSNFFNSMTNAIGDGMTFGQGQYNEDYQRMFEFVNDGDYYQNQIDQFRALFGQAQTAGKFGIEQTEYDAFVNPTDASKLKEHDKFISDTNLMAKDSEQISKALVLMLLSASKTKRDFHLVGFDNAHDLLSQVKKENEKNLHLNASAISTSETNIDNSIKTLTTFLQGKDFGIHWNHAGVAAAVREYFESRFVSYEDSPYRYNVNHQEHALDDANFKLKQMKQRLASDKSNIAQYETTQRNNVSQITSSGELVKQEWDKVIALMLQIGKPSTTYDYPAVPTIPNINKEPWNGEWTSYNKDSNKETQNPFYASLPNIQAMPTLPTDGSYKTKEEARVINETNIAATATALSEKITAQGNVDTANSQLNSLVGDLTRIKAQLSSERTERAKKHTFINQYNNSLHDDAKTKVSNEDRNNKALKSIRDAAKIKFDKVDDELKVATSKQGIAESDVQAAQATYDKGAKEVTELKGKLDIANTEYSTAQKNTQALQSVLDSLNAKLAAEKSKDDTYSPSAAETDKISAAQNSLTDAKAVEADDKTKAAGAKALYDAAVSKSAKQKDGLVSANGLLKIANGNLAAKKAEYQTTLSDFNKAQTDYDDSSTKLVEARKDLATLESKFKTYGDRIKVLDNLISTDEGRQSAKEKAIDDKKDEIVKLNGELSKKISDWKKADGVSRASTLDFNSKKNIFDAQVTRLRTASTSIAAALSTGTTKWTEEKALEIQIKKTIADKLVLEDPTITHTNPVDSLKPGAITFAPKHTDDDAHWSIKDQEWTVTDIENAKAQYVAIDKTKSKLYTERKEELIEDITKALS